MKQQTKRLLELTKSVFKSLLPHALLESSGNYYKTVFLTAKCVLSISPRRAAPSPPSHILDSSRKRISQCLRKLLGPQKILFSDALREKAPMGKLVA